MKKILSYIFLFSPWLLMGQNFSELNKFSTDSTTKENFVFFDATGDISSNTIQTDLMKKFLFGGQISQTMKQKCISNLSTDNTLGISGNARFTFATNLSKTFSKNLFLTLAYQQNSFNDSKLNKEMADLILNGNTAFLGESVPLNQVNLDMLNYSTISIGFLKKYENEFQKHSFGFSLGYAFGFSNFSTHINSGQLSFANDGSSIGLNGNYNIAFSDTSTNKFLKGNGFTTSFFYEFIKNKKYALSCSIENLGLITWNSNSFSAQKNISLLYSGIGINDITNIDNNLFNNTIDSTLNSIRYPKKTSSYQTKTPFTISLAGKIIIFKQFSLMGSIWKQVYTNQNIGYQLKPIYTLPFFPTDIAPYIYSNGYSPFDIGLEIIFRNIKNMIIKTDIHSLQITSHTIGGSFVIGYKF
ncbi:MAG: hypothetical protein WCP69_02420 [Bacteroidota bacterium]